MKEYKNTILGIISFILIILVIIATFKMVCYGTRNQAIKLEEQISASQSNIEIVTQKRVNELTQLINTVKDSKKFEQETLEKIIQARNEAQNGNIEQSNLTLKAVAEQYPELKTVDLYKNVMTATSVNENQLKQYRESYNNNVKSYNELVRSWPNDMLLRNVKYERKNYVLFTMNNSAINYNPSENNLWEE